jgi:hypothetical protein
MTGSIGQLVKSEWRKVTTTKMAWILALVALVFAAINTVTLTLVSSGVIPGTPQTQTANLLMEPDYIITLLAQAGSAATFALILGIIGMTSEYRHMTVTSSFLSTPRRGRVLAVKMALYGVLGAAIAVLAMVTVVVVLIVTLTILGEEHAPITASMIGTVFVGALVGLTLYAVLGVSLGALIRSQVAAIIIALIWVMLVEAILGLLLPSVGKWLPGGALNAAMDVSLRSDASGGFAQADRLPSWGGALMLLAYAVVFAVIASRTTLRRDIT